MKYTILCHTNCGNQAIYKIAARWSDGVIQELKTYSLCCAACLPEQFASSRKRFDQTRLLKDETSEPPGIYRLTEGRRDRELPRLADLEKELLERSQGKK
jgi:hypothetical protein